MTRFNRFRPAAARLAALALLAAMAGCAAQVVKEDHLKQKTAFALGVEQNEFTVSDRVDDGLQTRYSVKTNDGRKFNCYVEGTFSVVGSVVSDAICSQVSGNAKARPKSAPGTCNDLLRAAGRC